METDTVTLPESWASALINGDYSGLYDQDPTGAGRCRATEIRYSVAGWSFVSCEDEGRFTWSYDLYDTGAPCQGGQVLEYTIIRRQTK